MPPPERFGRYEVIRELGRGGMAVVYLSRDPRVGREVAIKVISADLAGDAEFRRRFDREAQALARLEHSAIVPLYDHGEEDGTPYLVFRYMEGGSLAERIARTGALPLEDVSAIARRVGAALDYAHAQGVIHRDIKPANILFDRNGEAWLGDFGISLAAERTSSLTSAAWIGSPAYMSPEQADGKPATAASDIYSLGCTLFEAITGRPPFTAEKPVALLLKHLQEPAPKASSVGRKIPQEVDRALLRAMAKDPGERTPTGGKLAESLGRTAARKPVAEAVRPPEAQGHGSVVPTIASAVDTGPMRGEGTRAVLGGSPVLQTVAQNELVVPPTERRWRIRWMLAGLIGLGLAGAVTASVFAMARGAGDDEQKASVGQSPSPTATLRSETATVTSSPTKAVSSSTATVSGAVGATPTQEPTPVPPTATPDVEFGPQPTATPTLQPTTAPTATPTNTRIPTVTPTKTKVVAPTFTPTSAPQVVTNTVYARRVSCEVKRIGFNDVVYDYSQSLICNLEAFHSFQCTVGDTIEFLITYYDDKKSLWSESISHDCE
ncbi:MAG: serine/threonine protein kinase [Dehalococcoidia bacterium]